MLDNYLKVALLTPDVMYDNTIKDLESKEFMEIFKVYKGLENISTDNIFNNGGRMSFVEIPNSLFEYITSQIISKDGRIKLMSNMHIIEKDRKIVICIPFKEFLRYINLYLEVLKGTRDDLMRDINTISEELLRLSKIKDSIQD